MIGLRQILVLLYFLKIGYSDTSEESSDEDELLLRAELREQEQRALNDLDIAMVSIIIIISTNSNDLFAKFLILFFI